MQLHDMPIPRHVLIAVAALVGFTLTTVAVARITDAPTSSIAQAEVAERVTLTFVDREDGAVEARTMEGTLHAVVPPETGGFVRGVLRALVRERAKFGLDSNAGGFTLNRLIDGHLTISDPATGEMVDLGAFGPTNQAAFAAIMTPGGRQE